MIALGQVLAFLLELREQYAFDLELDKLSLALSCAREITDLEEVFYRMQSAVCTSETEREIFQTLFAEKLLQLPVPGRLSAAARRAQEAAAGENARTALEERLAWTQGELERMQAYGQQPSVLPAVTEDPRLQHILELLAQLLETARQEKLRIPAAKWEIRVREAKGDVHTLEAIRREVLTAAVRWQQTPCYAQLLNLAAALGRLTLPREDPEARAKQLEASVASLQVRLQRAGETARWLTQAAEDARSFTAQRDSLTVKDGSLIHRSLFQGSLGAVQTTAEMAALLQVELQHMDPETQKRILAYIRANARVFRQTLRQRDSAAGRRHLDLRGTLRAAARHGGEPLVLRYRKPRKSRAHVVLLADLSGSCQNTAVLALFFTALMDAAFPGGCRKFAFVKDLYPVDLYFREVSPEAGVQAVLEHIPTRGVYSDYGTVLAQLRRRYGAGFHRDTTLILLGDARNNRNPTGAGDLRYLRDRCAGVYWLNPEPRRLWDTGDSVMGAYIAAGAAAYEGKHVGDLLEFLLRAGQH